MWFRPVNDMAEPASGMKAHLFREESSLSAKIRGGTVQAVPVFCLDYFQDVLAYPIRCLRMLPRVHLLAVQENCSKC
jgi:hypothetical protein